MNGLLLQQLAFITGYEDADCVQFFRRGAPFLGRLPCSGIGTPRLEAGDISVSLLREHAHANNAALVASLREDARAEELLSLTKADASLGRMSVPQVFDPSLLQGMLLAPRFPVVREKEDGSSAVRPVDNFSWSSLKQAGLGKTERKRKQKAALA